MWSARCRCRSAGGQGGTWEGGAFGAVHRHAGRCRHASSAAACSQQKSSTGVGRSQPAPWQQAHPCRSCRLDSTHLGDLADQALPQGPPCGARTAARRVVQQRHAEQGPPGGTVASRGEEGTVACAPVELPGLRLPARAVRHTPCMLPRLRLARPQQVRPAGSPCADLPQPLAQHGGRADDEGGPEQAAVVQASQERDDLQAGRRAAPREAAATQ